MKNIKSIFLSGLLALGAFGTLTFTSCNQDECKDVVCNNGGTCNEDNGSCNCPTGYEGSLCETELRAKFIKNWSAVDVFTGGQAAYNCIISAGAGTVTSVIIDNSFADDFFINNINATVNGNAINIAKQEPDNDDFTVEGTGTYSAGKITWNYTIVDPTGSNITVSGTWQ